MLSGALLNSSVTNEWLTPPALFDQLDAEFHFTLDPCATPDNALCSRFFTVEDDGLSQPWHGSVFVNPPYGRAIGLWVAKAHRESRNGATVVCLLPARTDTGYWHDYVINPGHEVRFLRGRLSFGVVVDGELGTVRAHTGAHNAPFPSAVVVMRPVT